MTRPSLKSDHLARPTASDIARWMTPAAADKSAPEVIPTAPSRRRPPSLRTLWRAVRDLWLGRAIVIRINSYTTRYICDPKPK